MYEAETLIVKRFRLLSKNINNTEKKLIEKIEEFFKWLDIRIKEDKESFLQY